jgi:hypothetical protein
LYRLYRSKIAESFGANLSEGTIVIGESSLIETTLSPGEGAETWWQKKVQMVLGEIFHCLRSNLRFINELWSS